MKYPLGIYLKRSKGMADLTNGRKRSELWHIRLPDEATAYYPIIGLVYRSTFTGSWFGEIIDYGHFYLIENRKKPEIFESPFKEEVVKMVIEEYLATKI